MAKTDIRSWSTTAGNNTDIEGVSLAEGWPSANINNSIRAVMANVKELYNAGFGYLSTETGNFTLDATDDGTAETNDNYGFVNVTAAATVTVPAATGVTANWGVLLHASGGALSLARSSTDTINGLTAFVVPIGWSALLKRISSSAWRVALLAPTPTGISAHKNGTDQTGIVTSTATKVTFGTELYDVQGEFASSTFTALFAGVYHVDAAVQFNSVADGQGIAVMIYKNGAEFRRVANVLGNTTNDSALISSDVQCAAGDTIEVYAIHFHGSNRDIEGDAERTWVSIHRVI